MEQKEKEEKMKAVVVSILNKNNMELFGNPEYKELTLVSILNKNNMELNSIEKVNYKIGEECQSLIRTIWNNSIYQLF